MMGLELRSSGAFLAALCAANAAIGPTKVLHPSRSWGATDCCVKVNLVLPTKRGQHDFRRIVARTAQFLAPRGGFRASDPRVRPVFRGREEIAKLLLRVRPVSVCPTEAPIPAPAATRTGR